MRRCVPRAVAAIASRGNATPALLQRGGVLSMPVRAVASASSRLGGGSSAAPLSALRAPAAPLVGAANAAFPQVQNKALARQLSLITQRMNQETVSSKKSSIMFTVKHQPGALQRALELFWKNDVNLTRIESRPNHRTVDYDFYVSFEGQSSDPNVQRLITDLNNSGVTLNVHFLDSATVPWFPTRAQDIDDFANDTLDAGADLESDHPGFHDKEYRKRREQLADIARKFKHGDVIPRITYTQKELDTWATVWDKLVPLLEKHACREHVSLLPVLGKECGYARNNIPQAADISSFLKKRTGFTLRPVSGLLSARNFLYGLAFRIFFSTQYIRHWSKPLYTPEPDIVHELMGHAPMFADPVFAEFSQEIGLAAIGATDEQVLQLARCYWFSVEFGLCDEDGKRKAYGAGLLSSFGELEYSMSDKPQIREWDPMNAAQQDYPITEYQPIYYKAKSFDDAKAKMMDFASSFARPFNVRYNERYETIEVDRDVRLLPPPKPKASTA